MNHEEKTLSSEELCKIVKLINHTIESIKSLNCVFLGKGYTTFEIKKIEDLRNKVHLIMMLKESEEMKEGDCNG